MRTFYPQEGEIYKKPNGDLFKVLMVARHGEYRNVQCVICQPQDETIPLVFPLERFAELFRYVPSGKGWKE